MLETPRAGTRRPTLRRTTPIMARHRPDTTRPHRVRAAVVGVVTLAFVAVVGFGVYEYVGLRKDLTTSDALQGNTPTTTGPTTPRQDTTPSWLMTTGCMRRALAMPQRPAPGSVASCRATSAARRAM